LAVGCVGLALLALAPGRGRWVPGYTLAKVQELSLSDQARGNDQEYADGSCEAALAAGVKVVSQFQARWADAIENGRLVMNFGKAAAMAERRAVQAFEEEAEEPSQCRGQREALDSVVRNEAWRGFLAMRRLLEDDVAFNLELALLTRMDQRGAPLRVQEKVEMLRSAVDSYREGTAKLLPTWAVEEGDPEQVDAERRLGELQFAIEDSASGRAVEGLWEHRRNKKLLSERAHGMKVSLDPALRLMVRPEGLGNIQVFTEGPVGPPNSPAEVNIGIMNDGSMADVYREHPVPPKFAVQPAVKVNLNIR